LLACGGYLLSVLRIAWIWVVAACASAPAQAPVAIGPKPEPVPIGEVPATRLAEVGYLPRCLAVDDTHVYWTRSSDLRGHVWRIPKTGGTPQQLTPEEISTPWTCIVVGDELWLGSGGNLVAVPKTGGAPRPVSDVVGEMVHGPDGVYVANPVTGLYRIAPGGTKTTITVRPVMSIVGGDVVVFATELDRERGYEYALWRVDHDQPVELVRTTMPPVRLALTNDTVLFAGIGENGSVREVRSMPLAGGPARLVATHGEALTQMFVDGEYLWWGSGDGIMQMSLKTEAMFLYAADPAGRHTSPTRERLVADNEAIYWLSIDMRGWKSSTRATIMRAPRSTTPPSPRTRFTR
jgi:hypothetical protein